MTRAPLPNLTSLPRLSRRSFLRGLSLLGVGLAFGGRTSQVLAHHEHLDTGMTVLHGGHVYSGVSATPAEALLVLGGRVEAVGSSAELLGQAGPDALRLDLAGRTILPGLVDHTCHLAEPRLEVTEQLQPVAWNGIETLGQGLAALAEVHRLAGPGAWLVVQGGWSCERLVEHRGPNRTDLDRVAPGRPVLVVEGSRRAYLSTAALEQLQLRGALYNPPGGSFERDERGLPTGQLNFGVNPANRRRLLGQVATLSGAVLTHDPARLPQESGIVRRHLLGGAQSSSHHEIYAVHDLPARSLSELAPHWLEQTGAELRLVVGGELPGAAQHYLDPARYLREQDAAPFTELLCALLDRGHRLRLVGSADSPTALAVRCVAQAQRLAGGGQWLLEGGEGLSPATLAAVRDAGGRLVLSPREPALARRVAEVAGGLGLPVSLGSAPQAGLGSLWEAATTVLGPSSPQRLLQAMLPGEEESHNLGFGLQAGQRVSLAVYESNPLLAAAGTQPAALAVWHHSAHDGLPGSSLQEALA